MRLAPQSPIRVQEKARLCSALGYLSEGDSHCACVNITALATLRLPPVYSFSDGVVNPRRACAARVTVLGLSVCLSVCLSARVLALQATWRPMSGTNRLWTTGRWILTWRFSWNDCIPEIWRENKRKSQRVVDRASSRATCYIRGGQWVAPTGCEQREDGYECGDFPETTAFQIYGVRTSEKSNVRSIAHPLR